MEGTYKFWKLTERIFSSIQWHKIKLQLHHVTSSLKTSPPAAMDLLKYCIVCNFTIYIYFIIKYCFINNDAEMMVQEFAKMKTIFSIYVLTQKTMKAQVYPKAGIITL
jgi:hypothetical protein